MCPYVEGSLLLHEELPCPPAEKQKTRPPPQISMSHQLLPTPAFSAPYKGPSEPASRTSLQPLLQIIPGRAQALWGLEEGQDG